MFVLEQMTMVFIVISLFIVLIMMEWRNGTSYDMTYFAIDDFASVLILSISLKQYLAPSNTYCSNIDTYTFAYHSPPIRVDPFFSYIV